MTADVICNHCGTDIDREDRSYCFGCFMESRREIMELKVEVKRLQK